MTKKRKLKNQRIRTKLNHVYSGEGRAKINPQLSGWLCGKTSYIRITDENDEYVGSLDGQPLYRLAKAIINHWEMENMNTSGTVPEYLREVKTTLKKVLNELSHLEMSFLHLGNPN